MINIIKKVMKAIEKNQMTKQMGEQSLDLRSFMFHTITYALAFRRSWPVLIFFSLNFSHSENSILSEEALLILICLLPSSNSRFALSHLALSFLRFSMSVYMGGAPSLCLYLFR